VVVVSLLGFSTTGAALAVKVAEASPWLAWPCAAFFIGLVLGLLFMWRGSGAWEAERKRKSEAAELVNEMLVLRDTAQRLLGARPTGNEHNLVLAEWHRSAHALISASENIVNNHYIPLDVRSLILAPKAMPSWEPFRNLSTPIGELLYRLTIQQAGLDEAAKLHAKNEGLD